MIDFRVIKVRSLLTANSYQPLRNFSPPSVLVTGFDLDRAEEISFNNVPTKEFAILSPTRLVFKIPTEQVNKPLFSLQIFGTAPGITPSGAISFDVGRSAKIEGLDRLVQSFLLILMTTPGSDAFDRTSGGGARGIIGRSTDSAGKTAAADLSLAVSRTKTELLAAQAKDRRIPPVERLLTAELSNVTFNPSTTTLSATVTLKNAVGESAQFNLNG
jgi:hypothetical protein